MISNKIVNLVIIGGNIYNQVFPIQNIIDASKKYSLKIFIITDNLRLSYPNKNFKNFKNFLKNKKLKFKSFDKNLKMNLYLKKNFDPENTLILSANCKWRIKSEIIKKYKYLFNYHNADLPSQRGAACHSWAIMMNKFSSSLNIHEINEDFDVGNILYAKKYRLKNSTSNLETVYRQINKVEKIFFKNFFSKFFKNKLDNKKQLENKSFYWPKLNQSKDSFVKWHWNSRQIKKFSDAFDKPFKGITAFYFKAKILLSDAKLSDHEINFHPFQYGMVYRKIKNRIYVATSNGGISFRVKKNSFSKIKLGYKFIN